MNAEKRPRADFVPPSSDADRAYDDSPEKVLSSAVGRMRRSGTLPGDAVAVIAHELRTPLNAMLGYTDMMRSEMFGPHSDPRYRDYSEIVHTAAEKLLRICNLMLLDETLDGPVAAEHPAAPAGQMIGEVLELFSVMAEERGVALSKRVDEGFPDLRIDPDLLEGTLGNLVSNAIKFTPRGGEVMVHASVSEADGAAIMVISDTGVGMPPETVVRIMKAFPVTARTGPHGDTGSGLGLGLVRHRLEGLGIGVEVQSKPNIGTAVFLKFPDALTESPASRPAR